MVEHLKANVSVSYDPIGWPLSITLLCPRQSPGFFALLFI